ncbi:MFS transporter [Herbiconiux sp. KACC 21604]|uniref:MFS transporter n=1 Tax=unclassified Herbiconiux TaxID=2618217 RepID=UPI001491EB81|nr:MFS transporter [Herbiconiux sp. SALV-R1]QJU52232.1 MFS transporter [Herbiconiux sp. SALV-R1]WPO87077.1 MFS transporter [Herbiconiux sp. KACC 21604]
MASRDDDDGFGHRRGDTAYRRILIGLFFAGVATFAQLYSPQAVLPEISVDLEVEPATSALLLSFATIGLALGVIPWSVVADRVGRVPAMTAAVVGATTVGLLVPFAPTLPLLLAGRFVEGLLVAGVPAVVIAYLSEEIHPADATRAAGTYVAGTSLGGLLGRIVAGPAGELIGWRASMAAVAAVCALATAAFIVVVPKAQGFRKHPLAVRSVLERLRASVRSPRLLALYAQGFLLMGAFVALYNYLAFRLGGPPFDVPASIISLLFLAYLAGTVSSSLAGWLVDRLGRRGALLATAAVFALGTVLTLTDALPLIIVGLVVATAGFFGAHSIASGWVGREAVTGRAQAGSLYNHFYYLGSSVFGWLGGALLVSFGWPGVVGMVCALVACAALVALLVLRPRPTP